LKDWLCRCVGMDGRVDAFHQSRNLVEMRGGNDLIVQRQGGDVLS